MQGEKEVNEEAAERGACSGGRREKTKQEGKPGKGARKEERRAGAQESRRCREDRETEGIVRKRERGGGEGCVKGRARGVEAGHCVVIL
eukprot:33629-Rhodomonas_salina.3